GGGGLAGGERSLRVGQAALPGGQLARALGRSGVGFLASPHEVGLGSAEPLAVGTQLLRPARELAAGLLVAAPALDQGRALLPELGCGCLDALALGLDPLLLVGDPGETLALRDHLVAAPGHILLARVEVAAALLERAPQRLQLLLLGLERRLVARERI